MKVAPGDENQAADVVNGLYEKHRKLQSGDVVLDIGAHVGYFSMMASDKVAPNGMVYAFEPNPQNFSRLMDNTQNDPRIRKINAAAWNVDAMMELFTMDGNSGGHSLFKFKGHGEPLTVKTIHVGDWCLRNMVTPTFVKIDAENSEANILDALLGVGLHPEFAMEIHNAQLYESCSDLLKAFGYKVEPESHTQYLCYAWR